MKTKYFIFIAITFMFFMGAFGLRTSEAQSSPTVIMPTYNGYCRITGSLDGISKSPSNPSVFVMLYKIQKVEQLTTISGYDCHGFVVGATAGLGLDSQITEFCSRF